MSIIFRNTPVSEPFTFDSLGNGWQQDRVIRPGGYPYYHYIQTETGAGKIEIDGRHYILKEQEGMLIAPFVRHSYEKTTDEWYTLFATFTGTVENALPQMLGNRRFILTGSDQGKRIEDLVSDCLDIYSASPVDEATLSVECYRPHRRRTEPDGILYRCPESARYPAISFIRSPHFSKKYR